MKWIKVVDPTREVPDGNKMRKFLYDTIRELAARFDGEIKCVEMPSGVRDEILELACLSSALYAAVDNGKIKTKTDIWCYCKRYYMPWLKEHGYVTTDVPYKPRPWQHAAPRSNVRYRFSRDPGNHAIADMDMRIKLAWMQNPYGSRPHLVSKGSLPWLLTRYRGRYVSERTLWKQLSKLPSLTGKRTMWEQFKRLRYEMVRFNLVNVVAVGDGHTQLGFGDRCLQLNQPNPSDIIGKPTKGENHDRR